ncbi:MAG: DUF4124 domain-containing protein [Gammaproteobacteria bacterium]|nr:DUF4124 domain-containing protein [Gammaproteobacteria bacterium]
MRLKAFSIFLIIALPIAALAQGQQRVYRWVDEEGVVHYGDSIPARYAELPKQVLNERGITVDHLQGKKTPEEIEAERLAQELQTERELQRRADQALLATYLTVDEILMHRDRRVELFQAQSRVTELYLRNLQRRLDSLERDAAAFKPYSSDPDAPLIDPDLAEDLRTTKETIARHENNLKRFQTDEQQIIARFDGDIDRFKVLKGID